MKAFFTRMVQRLIAHESSPQRLTYSIIVGIALAFSPFLGLQTPLGFVIAWLFSLNGMVITLVLYAVNNPWTLIPIVVADYLVGRWLMQAFWGTTFSEHNPRFVQWIWNKIGPYVGPYLGGEEFSFWAYQMGGALLALLAALVSYPLVVYGLRAFSAHPKKDPRKRSTHKQVPSRK